MPHTISTKLEKLRQDLDFKLESFHKTLGPQNPCLEAALYSLQGGAKRIRPLITLLLAQDLKVKEPPFFAAIAIEYFHTASLIADDLPCMDDDEERRGRKTAHIQYGESTALLASYGLISAGFDLIIRESERLRDSDEPFRSSWADILCLATKNAHFYTGFNGLISGQFYDLNSKKPNPNELKQIIDLKTSCLFKLAFVFGWLFGGGDLTRLDEVEKCARHFGLLFQIVDDIDDIAQDEGRQEQINMAALLGENKALQLVSEEKEAFQKSLQDLGLKDSTLYCLPDFILSKVVANDKAAGS